MRDENPDLKVTEISKVLGERWRSMDENQRKPYNKKAAADKERSDLVVAVNVRLP